MWSAADAQVWIRTQLIAHTCVTFFGNDNTIPTVEYGDNCPDIKIEYDDDVLESFSLFDNLAGEEICPM